MAQERNALVLEILRQDNALKMSIFEQRELVSTIRHYSQCLISAPEIDKLCCEVAGILNCANREGKLDPDSFIGLKKTGQLLWDHLLTKAVKDRLKTSQAKDLVLSLDEELISVPWEVLYTGDNFLSLLFNIGRVVRTKEKLSLPQYRSFSGALRMLVLANPTNDLKSAYTEGVFIKNQFDKRRGDVNIDFKSTHIDTLYVKKNLRDYDIVHFAGHCDFNIDNPQESGWIFADGKFAACDIMALGETLALPSLIFSNACQSAKSLTDSIGPDYHEKNYNLASAFLFSGVRHYIGTIRKIEDPVSLSFAKEFYAHLLNGNSVGQSIRLSRLRLIEEYGANSVGWISYLLYGDPNFILFRKNERAPILSQKNVFLRYKKYARYLCFLPPFLFLIIWLYTYLPSINPNTYVLFLKLRHLSAKGENQEVISSCRRIIEKEPEFLAAYPLLADTYQRLGNRAEALKYYFAYALNSEKRRDKKNLAAAYIGIAWVYHLQGEYAKAFDFYNKAAALSQGNNDKLNEAAALRKLAVWYIDKNDNDKALELLIKSSEINRQRQHIYEYRYNLACDYFDIGLVFTNKDDFVSAKEFYLKSCGLFEKLKLKNELSEYYFNLGELYVF